MTRRSRLTLGIMALTSLSLAAQQGRLASGDLEILAKVHHANQMEIEIGTLAASRGSADQVKRYGDLLAKDHRMGDGQVTHLASRKGVQIPSPTPASPMEQEEMQKQMAAMDHLKQLQGPAFDQAFTSAMIADHDKAINMLRGAAQKTGDPDVKKLLESMVPILEQHRAIAQQLNSDSLSRR
jgi:putative membrane protein